THLTASKERLTRWIGKAFIPCRCRGHNLPFYFKRKVGTSLLPMVFLRAAWASGPAAEPVLNIFCHFRISTPILILYWDGSLAASAMPSGGWGTLFRRMS